MDKNDTLSAKRKAGVSLNLYSEMITGHPFDLINDGPGGTVWLATRCAVLDTTVKDERFEEFVFRINHSEGTVMDDETGVPLVSRNEPAGVREIPHKNGALIFLLPESVIRNAETVAAEVKRYRTTSERPKTTVSFEDLLLARHEHYVGIAEEELSLVLGVTEQSVESAFRKVARLMNVPEAKSPRLNVEGLRESDKLGVADFLCKAAENAACEKQGLPKPHSLEGAFAPEFVAESESGPSKSARTARGL